MLRTRCWITAGLVGLVLIVTGCGSSRTSEGTIRDTVAQEKVNEASVIVLNERNACIAEYQTVLTSVEAFRAGHDVYPTTLNQIRDFLKGQPKWHQIGPQADGKVYLTKAGSGNVGCTLAKGEAGEPAP